MAQEAKSIWGGPGGGSLSGIFSGAASAVGDLFAAEGDRAEAGQYTRAAAAARQEEKFTESATRVQEMQQMRQQLQAVGAQEAGFAGSGLSSAGSAGDVLRDSASQGALAKSLIQYQGAETELGFEEQAQSYDSMAAAAKKASTGAMIGAGLSAASAIASLATLGA